VSVRQWLVALFTVSALAACGSDKPAQTPSAAHAEGPSAGSENPIEGLNLAKTPGSSPSGSKGVTEAKEARAAAFVKQQPGTFGIVVRDRQTGAVWKAGNTTATTWTASTIKLAIAADLLERHRQGGIALDGTDRANLDKALISSDNDAATALWNRYDGAGMLGRFQQRFGMRTLTVVSGYDTFWRHLRCSAEDLQALMTYVLDKLDPADRAYLVKTLRNVASNQRWGVWAAGSERSPGNKDGWAQKPVNGRTVWVTHTVGFAGAGERYVVAAMYEQGASGTLGKGAHAVSDAVATYFGAPVPAKITTP
jgi:predicted small lipoprotein YifL